MLAALKSFCLKKNTASNTAKVLLASILIAFAANLKISIDIIPFTMQTMVVLTISYALGSRLALFSLILWFLEGLCGFPVFASGGGLHAILSPSGGYIFGLIVMGYIMGKAKDHDINNVFTLSLYALVATAVLYICGLFVLSFYVPKDKILSIGLYPFIVTDIAKAFCAALLINPAYKIFKNL